MASSTTRPQEGTFYQISPVSCSPYFFSILILYGTNFFSFFSGQEVNGVTNFFEMLISVFVCFGLLGNTVPCIVYRLITGTIVILYQYIPYLVP